MELSYKNMNHLTEICYPENWNIYELVIEICLQYQKCMEFFQCFKSLI